MLSNSSPLEGPQGQGHGGRDRHGEGGHRPGGLALVAAVLDAVVVGHGHLLRAAEDVEGEVGVGGDGPGVLAGGLGVVEGGALDAVAKDGAVGAVDG